MCLATHEEHLLQGWTACLATSEEKQEVVMQLKKVKEKLTLRCGPCFNLLHQPFQLLEYQI